MNDGWRCPQCGRCYAPSLPQCSYCPNFQQPTPTLPTCLHEWIEGVTVPYCRKCGQAKFIQVPHSSNLAPLSKQDQRNLVRVLEAGLEVAPPTPTPPNRVQEGYQVPELSQTQRDSIINPEERTQIRYLVEITVQVREALKGMRK